LGEPVPATFHSPPKPAYQANALVVDYPMAIVDRQTGAIHFTYMIDYTHVFYMRSVDDGLTFSKPVEITRAFEGFRSELDYRLIGFGSGHGIQLTNGRLLIPIWLSRGGKSGWQHEPNLGMATIYSDDHGRTWRAGQVVARTSEGYQNPNEAAVVQLANGDVLLNIRSDSPRQRRLESVSHDGIAGWSRPAFVEDLPEPICMGSMVRLSEIPSGDKNRILFCNPNGLRSQGKGLWCARENMTVYLSYDEGKTWPVRRTIEQGPAGAGYSDLAVLPDGTILCAYGTQDSFRSASIAVARFNLEWLSDGRDSLVKP